jgi:hypothetical protein
VKGTLATLLGDLVKGDKLHTKSAAAHHSGCGAACRSGTPLDSEYCLPSVACSPTGQWPGLGGSKLNPFVVTLGTTSRVWSLECQPQQCLACQTSLDGGQIPFSWQAAVELICGTFPIWDEYSRLGLSRNASMRRPAVPSWRRSPPFTPRRRTGQSDLVEPLIMDASSNPISRGG